MIAVVYAIPLRGERGLLRQAATVETGGLLVAFRHGDHLVLADDILDALERPPAGALVHFAQDGIGGILPVGQHHLGRRRVAFRSEEHTSELQSLMRISYAVFCLKKKK